MSTQIRIFSFNKDSLSCFLYLFAKSLKKEAFLLQKGLSQSRFNSLMCFNKLFNLKNRCIKQQLYTRQTDLLKVNSSLLKFWFAELSLVGLGFRFSVQDSGSSFRLNLGYSHSIVLPLGVSLFLLKKKKRCLVVSSDLLMLRKTVYQVLKLRKVNKYKLKGLQLKGVTFKLKPGKRSK